MAFFRLDNGSSPADAPTAVVETRIPDAWAQYTKRRRERVRDAKQKFTEMIGDRQYDPDAKTSFDGQIDAETADWLTEDVSTHREYRREIGERLTEAERELTRAERELAAAEEEVKDAEQKMRTPPPGRWQDPEAMLRARHPWWLWFLVGLAISGDLAAFYVVLELMLRQYPVVVAVAVLATSAIAVVCTHAIGRAWRRHVAQVPDRSDAWLWVPLGGWILLGMAAAGVRLFFSSHLASVSAFGAPETSLARGDELAVLPAVIFLALYIGSGICSIYASYEAYDPAAKAYRLARLLRDKALQEVARCAGLASAAKARKERIEKEDTRAAKYLERAQLVTHNEIVGLKHFVRHRMAENTDSLLGLPLFMEDAPPLVRIPAEEDE